MRKIRKIAAVLLAMILTAGFFPASAVRAFENNNLAEIAGINYNRITQKAAGGSGETFCPVELSLGDLHFQGTLTGNVGLTYEELNKIIYEVLDEKGLTVERVALVSEIANRVEADAEQYWKDKVLETYLSYLTLPFIPASVADFYAYWVHGDYMSAASSSAKTGAKEAAKKALKAGVRIGGKVGKAAGDAAGIVKDKPVVGIIVNSLDQAASWLGGSERFDAYLKLLEKNLEIINDFYVSCSRRANDLADKKGMANVWTISFDEKRNYRTYNCSFWGIDGVTMAGTLNGKLEKEADGDYGASGNYVGELTLVLESADFTPVEQRIERTEGCARLAQLMANAVKETNEGKPTVLRRVLTTMLTIRLSGEKGVQQASVLQGGFQSGSDEMSFSFYRHVVWKEKAVMDAVGINDIEFSSTEVDKVNARNEYTGVMDGKTVQSNTITETISQPLGTVFRPLESSPVITVAFPK